MSKKLPLNRSAKKSDVKPKNLFTILAASPLPRLETEILLAYLLNKTLSYLLTHPKTQINQKVEKKFQTLVKKRLQNWPIAYLSGQKEFYGLDFKVSPAVLVPRPETEMIVDELLTINQVPDSARTIIIDVGTGSGAIIISAAKNSRRLFPTRFKKMSFWATDISPAALALARLNARHHRLAKKIKFKRSHLIQAFNQELLDLNTAALTVKTPYRLIIAANLPYLKPSQIKRSPTISREPRLALDGGPDGLKYYRLLFKQIKNLKLLWPVTIIGEIDPGQANKARQLAKSHWPGAKIEVKKDLAGLKRLIKINC